MRNLVQSNRVVKPVSKADQTTATTAVVDAARKWWRWHRPCAWDKRRHLKSPTVNCTGEGEARLAEAVAIFEASQ